MQDQHDDEVRVTAYHEAGHAVVADLRNQLSGDVTIVPAEGALGHCRYRRDIVTFLGNPCPCAAGPGCIHLRAALRRDAVTAMAAYAAEYQFKYGEAEPELTVLDRPHVVEVCDLVESLPPTGTGDFVWQTALALRELFARRPVRRAVRAVAEALLARGTLGEEEVERIVTRAMGRRAYWRYYSILMEAESTVAACPRCGEPLWWALGRRTYCGWCRRSRSRAESASPGRSRMPA